MRFFSTALLCMAAIGSAWAQPAITGVVNAANYSTGIAQGSIFVVFGSNLGPAQLASAPGYPLTTTLSGTSIKFTPAAGGPAFDALVVYTSAGQVAGLLQSQAPTGNYNVTISYNGQTSANTSVAVVARNFGLLSLAASGTGPAVAQIADQGSRINQFGAPASPGQTIVLYGIGLGPITAPDNNPPGLQDLKGPAAVKVLLGDVEIDPIYAGRSPGIAGLDQINFVIPAKAPQGCTVPLRVRVAGANTTYSTTLSIAATGASICVSPLYSADVLRRLDAGGSISVGGFVVFSQALKVTLPIIGTQTIKSETVTGGFSSTTLANIADIASPATAGLSLSVGTCTVFRITADQNGNVVGGQSRFLDAGAQLTLNGPGGITNKAMTKVGNSNAYLTTLGDPTGGITIPGVPSNPNASPGVSAGTFTIAGPGGSEVGAFTASVNVPQPITWTNQTPLTASPIIRSSGVTVTWSGAGANDLVTVLGSSGARTGGTATNPVYLMATFVCLARGDAGTFSVPSSVLTQLPPTTGTLPDNIGILGIAQASVSATNGRFTAPLTAGGTADGLFTYSIGSVGNVTWQ